ncbi:YdbL family protein [Psychromonas sp. MME2]|uniref:YdbL family protein n=1 Tax=unclassified Psychromonas TaxID=2614957 RepID=UPI00339BAC24
MKKLALLLSLLMSFSALALDLSEAKELGLIGEKKNGLLGVVKESSEAATLVKEINEKRLVEYKKIAAKNSMSLEQVAILAGDKTISKTAPGQYIENSSGQWVVK